MKLSLIESRLFGRICYGFRRDELELVEIVPGEASVVKNIFDLYRSGNSLESIQSYLFEHKILSPSGNEKWSRDVINKILNNGKYTKGIVDFEEFCDVHFMKKANCRNSLLLESRMEKCQKQPKTNLNGHMQYLKKSF